MDQQEFDSLVATLKQKAENAQKIKPFIFNSFKPAFAFVLYQIRKDNECRNGNHENKRRQQILGYKKMSIDIKGIKYFFHNIVSVFLKSLT